VSKAFCGIIPNLASCLPHKGFVERCFDHVIDTALKNASEHGFVFLNFIIVEHKIGTDQIWNCCLYAELVDDSFR
jgi:hypothetical protein